MLTASLCHAVNNIIGTLPEGLAQLTNLTQLVLGNNQLSGSIPPILFSELTQLITVSLVSYPVSHRSCRVDTSESSCTLLHALNTHLGPARLPCKAFLWYA